MVRDFTRNKEVGKNGSQERSTRLQEIAYNREAVPSTLEAAGQKSSLPPIVLNNKRQRNLEILKSFDVVEDRAVWGKEMVETSDSKLVSTDCVTYIDGDSLTSKKNSRKKSFSLFSMKGQRELSLRKILPSFRIKQVLDPVSSVGTFESSQANFTFQPTIKDIQSMRNSAELKRAELSPLARTAFHHGGLSLKTCDKEGSSMALNFSEIAQMNSRGSPLDGKTSKIADLLNKFSETEFTEDSEEAMNISHLPHIKKLGYKKNPKIIKVPPEDDGKIMQSSHYRDSPVHSLLTHSCENSPSRQSLQGNMIDILSEEKNNQIKQFIFRQQTLLKEKNGKLLEVKTLIVQLATEQCRVFTFLLPTHASVKGLKDKINESLGFEVKLMKVYCPAEKLRRDGQSIQKILNRTPGDLNCWIVIIKLSNKKRVSIKDDYLPTRISDLLHQRENSLDCALSQKISTRGLLPECSKMPIVKQFKYLPFKDWTEEGQKLFQKLMRCTNELERAIYRDEDEINRRESTLRRKQRNDIFFTDHSDNQAQSLDIPEYRRLLALEEEIIEFIDSFENTAEQAVELYTLTGCPDFDTIYGRQSAQIGGIVVIPAAHFHQIEELTNFMSVETQILQEVKAHNFLREKLLNLCYKENFRERRACNLSLYLPLVKFIEYRKEKFLAVSATSIQKDTLIVGSTSLSGLYLLNHKHGEAVVEFIRSALGIKNSYTFVPAYDRAKITTQGGREVGLPYGVQIHQLNNSFYLHNLRYLLNQPKQQIALYVETVVRTGQEEDEFPRTYTEDMQEEMKVKVKNVLQILRDHNVRTPRDFSLIFQQHCAEFISLGGFVDHSSGFYQQLALSMVLKSCTKSVIQNCLRDKTDTSLNKDYSSMRSLLSYYQEKPSQMSEVEVDPIIKGINLLLLKLTQQRESDLWWSISQRCEAKFGFNLGRKFLSGFKGKLGLVIALLDSLNVELQTTLAQFCETYRKRKTVTRQMFEPNLKHVPKSQNKIPLITQNNIYASDPKVNSIRFALSYARTLKQDYEVDAASDAYRVCIKSCRCIYGQDSLQEAHIMKQYGQHLEKMLQDCTRKSIVSCQNKITELLEREAIDIYSQAASIFKSTRSLKNGMVPLLEASECYNRIAKISNYSERSIKSLQKSIQLLERTLGEKHPLSADIYCSLGHSALLNRDYTKASQYLLKSKSCLEQRVGADDPEVKAISKELGLCLLGERRKSQLNGVDLISSLKFMKEAVECQTPSQKLSSESNKTQEEEN